jgi:hypothetical protein
MKRGKVNRHQRGKSETGDRTWPVAARTEAGPDRALPRERKIASQKRNVLAADSRTTKRKEETESWRGAEVNHQPAQLFLAWKNQNAGRTNPRQKTLGARELISSPRDQKVSSNRAKALCRTGAEPKMDTKNTASAWAHSLQTGKAKFRRPSLMLGPISNSGEKTSGNR